MHENLGRCREREFRRGSVPMESGRYISLPPPKARGPGGKAEKGLLEYFPCKAGVSPKLNLPFVE